MIPEIGHFALILALCMAIIQATVPLAGIQLKMSGWIAMARPAAWLQLLFLAVAFACLAQAFVVHDFSVEYVARNSNTALPLLYRMSAIWGAHEGSLLLWVLMLGIWTGLVGLFSRSLPAVFGARVLAVMGMVSIGFLLFMLFTSNPFARLFPTPIQGRDLNPLLQDPGLAIHPPMLYMGYVGFSVAFAFAIAALLGGRLDATWARWSRPWTTSAWCFLTVGIALGSWWAYNELGWGGWWFWDPVENASFMPWLVGTALIHSLAVSEKRGAFKRWTVLLAITAFSLSLLGTFLVRSGVLVSVHAFATDPERGVFILLFLGIVIGSSLLLYATRAHKVGGGGDFALFSRESLLLVNNVLLVAAAASVLLGTLYPLFLDALGQGKISVGPPYFDRVFLWIMLPLLFFLGVGPSVRWKKDDPKRVIKRLRWPFFAAIPLGLILPFLLVGELQAIPVLSVMLALWVALSSLQLWLTRPKLKSRTSRFPISFLGMVVAHIGVAMFAIGVCFTKNYSVEKDVRMAVGEVLEMQGYRFRFDGVESLDGPNYKAIQAKIRIFQGEQEIATLSPEKRTYRVQTMPMTEAAIDVGPLRDLYVALGEDLKDGSWSLRLYYKPFIRWIWLGALLMAIGGVLAISDRRYRLQPRAAMPKAQRQPEKALPPVDALPEGGQ